MTADTGSENLSFSGAGLIDLQINGVNGIDFNDVSLTPDDMLYATLYLLKRGVTSYMPTVITNSEQNTISILNTIRTSCNNIQIVNDCVGGIHLEGPFISAVVGAVGAHDKKYVRTPDWKLFKKFQIASGGRIRLVTIAPELNGSVEFIEQCMRENILVAIGHSMATTGQIKKAVLAGCQLSTHLGNGVPQMLPRHPNIIWDQLAQEELFISLIADGIHVPDSFLKVAIRVKPYRVVLVSDATRFAGMPAGEYSSHIGNTVIVDEHKRVSMKGSLGQLAGAAKILPENIEYVVNHGLASLHHAWTLGSTAPAELMKEKLNGYPFINDKVILRMEERKLIVDKVFKNGQLVT